MPRLFAGRRRTHSNTVAAQSRMDFEAEEATENSLLQVRAGFVQRASPLAESTRQNWRNAGGAPQLTGRTKRSNPGGAPAYRNRRHHRMRKTLHRSHQFLQKPSGDTSQRMRRARGFL